MRLNDPLVTSFIYEGDEYEINLAFDLVLDAFDVLDDNELRNYEKAEINIALLLDIDVKGVEAVELWNYIYNEFIHVEENQIIEYDLKGNPMPVQDEDEGPSYSLSQDAEYIYAGFMQTYQMDLYELQGKLHWNKFRALLGGLDVNSKFMRVVQIRQAELPSGKGSEGDRENLVKLKKVFALKD